MIITTLLITISPNLHSLPESENFHPDARLNAFPDLPHPPQDTILQYPINEQNGYPFSSSNKTSPLYLKNPSNIESRIVYDPVTKQYVFTESIGSWNYRTPVVMSEDEYRDYEIRQAVQDYWRLKASGGAVEEQLSFIPPLSVGGEAFDKLFGSNVINIVPTGSAELIFGFNLSKIENPNINERLRSVPSFTFDEKIIMNVAGSIGDKMKMDISYNTEATFDFENQTKLAYAGDEDEIIKKIEAGNVNLPLPGSLINGSMSLFGLKTEMQFGKLNVTTVFSQQKGESSVINVQGGAQLSEYQVTVDDYDANKHFFLSDYFRDTYNRAVSRLPVITSDVSITRIEVWITNKTTNFEDARNIIAVNDLGEGDPYSVVFSRNPGQNLNYPRNELNNAYDRVTTTHSAIRDIKNATGELESAGLILGRDFEKIENARLLSSREYTFNDKLGYISLNTALNTDEILAVAYEYTYRGQTYRVGELSTSSGISAPQSLVMKLLKPSNFTPSSYTWDLMMKNVYAIGAYQVNRQDFTLDVLYRDDRTGNAINYLPDGVLNSTILIRLFNLDNMNEQRDPYPDGIFDYIEGITITSSNGRIFFPLVEPFGTDLAKILRDSLSPGEAEEAISKYVYQELYDSTKTKAQQIAEKNKFLIAGEFSSSSSSEIMLNAMNVPQGSVKVTAGGRELVENQDYTVDYMLGRVTIINQGILESGTPIRISLENQSLFNFQTKTLVGTHLDYKISDNFNVGGTVMHLTERPLTQKVNIGDEPISNTIWGLNTSFNTESRLLTNIVDKLPFLETKAPSSLTLVGEFAHLIPGHSRAIAKEGNAYIDDFEGSETSIDLKHFSSWRLASTPRGFFKEAELNNDLRYGYGRAKFAWYQIDPLFLRKESRTPEYLKSNPDMQSSAYVYEVYEQDIFPNKENPSGIPTNISVLNLAFYPDQRGPYNYDWENIDRRGRLLNPRSRWGGIMREIYSSDFELANVEFIEFWLMDPFAEMEDHSGGELYLNLGNVSEDVLKDSRKTFENGLPATELVQKVDTTVWGRVPVVQSLVQGFSEGDEARKFQDVGLDGLSSEEERQFFSERSNSYLSKIDSMYNAGTISRSAYEAIIQDPSGDDYHYYRGSDYDGQKLDILSRYKNYNSHEGNSPSDLYNPESYPTSGTSLPDIEDINRDNTLSENESYFFYRVDLRPEELEVGRNFIVDKVVDRVNYVNGTTADVTWYQFRIPIHDYEGTVGDISDFKSIRFMRMFLTNFSDSTYLRFAKLDLVRGEWRRYALPFSQGGEAWTGYEPSEGTFSISAVNIEENAGKEPVNYVLPPGFNRQIDPMQPQLRQLNEQSIVLKILELTDGDARAAYKNTELDIRQYRKIRMEAHAEAIPGIPLQDDEITAFIRIGSDYQDNYYEYEVPLKLTAPGKYNNDSQNDRELVWPEENRFEIDLELFREVKQARNHAMNDLESEVTINSVYSILDDRGNRVSVSGNPNMSSVRTIMIGVRNPGKGNNVFRTDDGLPKSAEVWLNELRLTDFNEKGGWAANGRATAKLADLGNVTFAGSTSTPGFGSIEQKVNERSHEEIIQYDVSSNLQMGKFFNQEAGVNLPVYVGYSKAMVNPEYNPLDPDILLKEAIQEAETKVDRDSIIRNARDVVERKTFALTNIRMNKSGATKRFYSLANWSASFAMNEMNSRNPNLEYYNTLKLKGNLSYNYTIRPKNVQPFKSVGWMSSPWWRLIKDFNFNVTPSQISLRTDMDRYYLEKQTRNINNPNFRVIPTFKKDFLWNRYFDLKYDITRSLRFDFSSTNIARIDEPEGRWNRELDSYETYRDSLWNAIASFGRTTSYFHQFNVSYTLPINKIPLLDWVSVNARYGGTYGWDVGPIIPYDPEYGSINLGNSIKNSNTVQLNGQLNLVNLYNKVGFLKGINDKYRNANARAQQTEKRIKTKTYTRDNLYMREGRPRYIVHNLRTKNIEVNLFDENDQPVEVTTEIMSETRIRITSESAVRSARVVVTGSIEKGENPLIFIAETTLRVIMGVRTVNLTYSESGGTLLPGYLPGSDYFGMSNYDGKLRPGWEFVSGWQNYGYAEKAFRNGLLTPDSALNDPFNMNETRRFNARANIEPFNGLKIDLTTNHSEASNLTEFFTADENGNLPDPAQRGKVESGNFSMSYISLGTAFEGIDNKVESSKSFAKLKDEYRKIISGRLASEYFSKTGVVLPPDSANPEYASGYGPTSQDVLIPAFLAAYAGKDPNEVSLSARRSFLEALPNWQVRFDGLGRIESFRKYVNSITINHAYRSTYSIGSFISNPFFIDTINGAPFLRDLDGNFMVEYNINTISLNEQFSPLFDLNMDWKNSLTTRLEIKRSRTIALNMANTQVNEVNNSEIVLGAGYRFNEVPLIINQKEFRSDLNVRFDFSWRNSRTVIRKLEDVSGSEITAGQKILSIKASADYMLSDKFSVRAFYDQRLTTPYISNSYPNANYNVGVSLTFTL
ncbi:MAG: cell surface protein SprA [Bacteroidales bacterium]|nr:cell surface protein SprA [Bacteroidales bacterium]